MVYTVQTTFLLPSKVNALEGSSLKFRHQRTKAASEENRTLGTIKKHLQIRTVTLYKSLVMAKLE